MAYISSARQLEITTEFSLLSHDGAAAIAADPNRVLSGLAEWHPIKVTKIEPPGPLLVEVPEIVGGHQARCPRYVRRITCVTRISGHRYFSSVKYRGF